MHKQAFPIKLQKVRKSMKRIFKILAFILSMLLLVSCGAPADTEGTSDTNPPEPDETKAPETDAPETEAPETEAPETETPETEKTETEETETEEVVEEEVAVFNKMPVVLLMGQSNMAGRGHEDFVEPISDERILMLRDGEWVTMQEPIHTDSDVAGIGLAASFAKAFVETFDCEIGLVPVAVGGSAVSLWKKNYSGDGRLYETVLEQARKAQETGEICAILWHQGESNRTSTAYVRHFKEVMDPLIEDLGLDKDKLVIISGELGAWEGKDVERVNSALAAIEAEGYYPNYAVVSQEGLTNTKGERYGSDSHFDSPSLRVFGYRYFEAFYEEFLDRECPYEYSQDPNDYRINK